MSLEEDEFDDEWIEFVTLRSEVLFQNHHNDENNSSCCYSLSEEDNTAETDIQVIRHHQLLGYPKECNPSSGSSVSSDEMLEAGEPHEYSLLDRSNLSAQNTSSFLNSSFLSGISEIEKVDESIDFLVWKRTVEERQQQRAKTSILEYCQQQISKLQDDLCTSTTTMRLPKLDTQMDLLFGLCPKWQDYSFSSSGPSEKENNQ